MDSLLVFQKFVPEHAANYCNELYKNYTFQFKIKKARQTKLGDFRIDLRTKKQTISVNNDLNPYAFLITYLHEVAHLLTYKKHGFKVKPHGEEWKQQFRDLIKPVLNERVFPSSLLPILINYFQNPAASSCADPQLLQALRKYDVNNSDVKYLSDIKIGEEFVFQNRTFRKLEKKRTRSLCLELRTNRKYMISELAEVL